ncbi:MAG: three-Cys-motif partner protein TcmP [Alphaproteobacteria bacterium]|nr:three-Cys-motif partner protein TcmP [Alphaproteobacteria bacterium]
MVKKHYDWSKGEGEKLPDHSRKKHQILEAYFRQYLITRCKPYHINLNLIIVDGFSGAGLYKNNELGSPLLFLRVLNETVQEINIKRAINNMPPAKIRCWMFFNDSDQEAIKLLKENAVKYTIDIEKNTPSIALNVEYSNQIFAEFYYNKKSDLSKYQNIIFNLDQYGYTDVSYQILNDIIKTWNSVEIFLTFAIDALTKFLPSNYEKIFIKGYPELSSEIKKIYKENCYIQTKEGKATAERMAFSHFQNLANYVSPFLINNTQGYYYWSIHIAKNYRAREVYNNILHEHSSYQAHYGGAGLDMLAYKTEDDQQIYLFDDDAKKRSMLQLMNDIPKYITDNGNMSAKEFYSSIYNHTPASKETIDKVISENLDLEIITEKGNPRRVVNTISGTDIIRRKRQFRFYF